MRQTATIVCILAAACGAAIADELTIRNIPYPGVQVVGVAECHIIYELRGNTLRRALEDVSLIKLGGQTSFNDAEQKSKDGKAAEAVALYDKAAEKFSARDWQLRLIRLRRLPALNAAGMTDRAVEDWLAVVDDNGVSRATTALRPDRLGKRGSRANARAIRLLEQRLPDAKPKAFQQLVEQLLVKLYTAEGMRKKIDELKGASGRGPGPVRPVTSRPGGVGTTVSVAPSRLSKPLREAVALIEAGKYEAAAEAIRARLRDCGEVELPKALLLRGQALLLSYEKRTSKAPRATLLAAGLSLMRVAACTDPSNPEVPQALFLAAAVCQHLGNDVAAANAYRLLIERHRNSEWARKAEAALQAAPGSG